MQEEKPLNLAAGSLYAPLPIPAFQVLANAKEHNAQKVLLALVMHMGRNSNCVWPSYPQMMWVLGIGSTSVRNGLKVLETFGFIKISKWRQGKQERNKYYLQRCCWNSGLMADLAKKYRKKGYRCFACLALVDRGEFGFSDRKRVHFGCGGFVLVIKPRKALVTREEIDKD